MKNQYINNLIDDAAALKKEAEATNLNTAVTNYMSVLAATSPDNKLPNGMTAEEAAQAAINGASYYINAREQELETGMEVTMDDLRKQIAENMSEMSLEQGVRYIAMLQVMYRFYMPADGVVPDDAVAEYQQILAANSNKHLQEQLDDLIDSLDVGSLHSLLRFAKEAAVEVTDKETDEQVKKLIELAGNRYAAVEDAVVCGVVMYGEAVRGNVEDFSPESDPGVVTAVTAAYMDAIYIAKMNGGTTMKDIYNSLSRPAKWLASALGIITAGLVMAWAASMAPEIALLVANFGVAEKTAEMIGMIFYWGVTASQVLLVDRYSYEYGTMIKAVGLLFSGDDEPANDDEEEEEREGHKHRARLAN